MMRTMLYEAAQVMLNRTDEWSCDGTKDRGARRTDDGARLGRECRTAIGGDKGAERGSRQDDALALAIGLVVVIHLPSIGTPMIGTHRDVYWSGQVQVQILAARVGLHTDR